MYFRRAGRRSKPSGDPLRPTRSPTRIPSRKRRGTQPEVESVDVTEILEDHFEDTVGEDLLENQTDDADKSPKSRSPSPRLM